MSRILVILIMMSWVSCKQDSPKKPEQDQYGYGYGDGYSYGSGYGSEYGSSDYSNQYGNSSYYDQNSGLNSYNSGYGTYNNFNNQGSFNYQDPNCQNLYGQNYNTQFDQYGSMNQNQAGMSNFSNYSNPLADCSQFNQSSNYSYNYQDPYSYNQNSQLQMQRQWIDQIEDQQRNQMLMSFVPSILGALTGNQALSQMGATIGQNQMMYPKMNMPGMGMSGFMGQFGTMQNPYNQHNSQFLGVNPQMNQGMFDQFGQYQNYQTYNDPNFFGTNQYSNRNFYDDPNFSNGLMGRNSFYNQNSYGFQQQQLQQQQLQQQQLQQQGLGVGNTNSGF